MLRPLQILSLVLALIALVPTAQAAAPPILPKITETFDVPYHCAHSRQILDIFSPQTPGPHPVVLMVHGGTWLSGDKDFGGLYRDACRTLARSGVVAVSINYRLSPLVKHPEHIKDVARAYAWVVKNIAKHRGDPEKIVLAGHSAGGHLVSLLALDRSYLRDSALGLTAKQQESLRGVISISGVYRIPDAASFRAMAKRMVEIGKESKSVERQFVTMVLMIAGDHANPFPVVFGNEESRTAASPINHIHKDAIPFLMLSGEFEIPGFFPMFDEFEKEMKKQGNSIDREKILGTTHRSVMAELHWHSKPMTKKVLDFILKVTDRTKG
jgi:acetyl esterase/lipase